MQDIKQNTLELLIGAAVIAISVSFFIYVYGHSDANDMNSPHYNASFDRIDGLVVGSDVRMSGVTIGKISHLDIEPQTYMANVTFSVKSALKIPKDSSAEVVSDGLLGGKYLAIVPGGDDNYLEAGATIVHTQSSVNLESMIGQLIFSNKADKKTT